MSLGGPLRGELSKYRKRKQLSRDGTVAGTEYTHYRRGYNRSPFNQRDFTSALYESRASQSQDAAGHDAGVAPEAAYAPDQQHYLGQSPGSQFYDEPLAPKMQDTQPGSSGLADLGIHYDDSLVDPHMIEEQMQQAAEPVEKQEPVPFTNDVRAHDALSSQASLEERLQDDDSVQVWESSLPGMDSPPTASPMSEPAAEAPQYDACLMTQAMFDQAMGQLAQPLAEPPAAAEPVEPDPFEQQRQMYDQQMQQLMGPYMMQGFGAGMMGPGFGPGM
jgi:hypothetical protein